METTMKFQQNATVVAANDEEIGHLTRIVMDPKTKVVTHIALRMKSLLKKEEKLVPIDRIPRTTEDQIVLSGSIEDLESLPPFEEKIYVPAGETPGVSPSAGQAPAGYGAPLGDPLYSTSSGEKYVRRIEQNIPEGTVALKEGAKVITSEGKYVGKVERIVADSPEDQATHLLISRGLLTEEKRLVPINWVQRIGEDKIYLSVKKDSVEELASIPAEQS